MSRPLICGFLKVKDEILRGNLHMCLANLSKVADTIVACDDGSTDGTYEELQKYVPMSQLIRVPPDKSDFRDELKHKQTMLGLVCNIKPMWVYWVDGDEVLDAAGTASLRDFAADAIKRPESAWRFHYTQLWRNTCWARTDDGFDDGWYLKLWRWDLRLKFDVRRGTHRAQVPQRFVSMVETHREEGSIGKAPFEIIHYGNVGKSLVFKAIQYYGGLGGVDRHIRFADATFRRVPDSALPPEAFRIIGSKPRPFGGDEIKSILEMENLKKLPETFAVVVPTYNRADTLPRALQSLIDQTYQKWVAFVLDDGSTDQTPTIMREWQERDPRIFYARYSTNRGGVAMNEVGMAIAVERCEYWTRLGSDDYFFPKKLERDAEALKSHEACFGPYVVLRNGKFAEVCSPPDTGEQTQSKLAAGGFTASWANIAVHSDVLARVRKQHGNFCDPGLKNMEDLLVNQRIAREAKIAWRGVFDGKLVVDPQIEACQQMRKQVARLEPDAIWRCDPHGASGAHSVSTISHDSSLSRELYEAEKLAPVVNPVAISLPMGVEFSGEVAEMLTNGAVASKDVGYRERSLKHWQSAGSYPFDKEAYYPEHAEVQEFGLYSGRAVLEYGCGGGSDARSYAVRGALVTACDIVPENLAVAASRFGEIVQPDEKFVMPSFVHLAASSPLPFESESFDVITSHGVVHHIVEPDPVMAEFTRVLVPGGVCYLMLYTEGLWDNFAKQIKCLVAKHGVTEREAFAWCTDGAGAPYARPYTEAEGQDLLARAGLKTEKVTTWNHGLFRTFKARKE